MGMLMVSGNTPNIKYPMSIIDSLTVNGFRVISRYRTIHSNCLLEGFSAISQISSISNTKQKYSLIC